MTVSRTGSAITISADGTRGVDGAQAKDGTAGTDARNISVTLRASATTVTITGLSRDLSFRLKDVFRIVLSARGGDGGKGGDGVPGYPGENGADGWPGMPGSDGMPRGPGGPGGPGGNGANGGHGGRIVVKVPREQADLLFLPSPKCKRRGIRA